MSGPFKMKGSPMKRNFGISPMKDTIKEAGYSHGHPHITSHTTVGDVNVEYRTGSEKTKKTKDRITDAKNKEIVRKYVTPAGAR